MFFYYFCIMKERNLCQLVEQTAGRRMESHRDFVWLADELERRTNERLSPTTLKRIWGYINEPASPRRFSLDVLARYAGLSGYNAFLQLSDRTQSNLVLAPRLTDDDFYEGMRVRLRWMPDRECLVEHLGGARFKVVESKNSKLAVGDLFSCHLFIMHEPLYLDNLSHRGRHYEVYVAGKQDGISFEVE